MTPFRDSSRDGMLSKEDAEMLGIVRRKIPQRVFFAFDAPKVTAPEGYAFNHRGDFISLKRESKRRGVKVVAA